MILLNLPKHRTGFTNKSMNCQLWVTGRRPARDLVFSHLTIVRFSRVPIVNQVTRDIESFEDYNVHQMFASGKVFWLFSIQSSCSGNSFTTADQVICFSKTQNIKVGKRPHTSHVSSRIRFHIPSISNRSSDLVYPLCGTIQYLSYLASESKRH